MKVCLIAVCLAVATIGSLTTSREASAERPSDKKRHSYLAGA